LRFVCLVREKSRFVARPKIRPRAIIHILFDALHNYFFMPTMSSHVFLSNVDDYLAPSQACVNPLFSNDKGKEEKKQNENVGSVQPRVRRRGRVRRPTTTNVPKPQQRDPVKASIADCLACSGCVTTAETVLVEEQHSLEALRELVQAQNNSDAPLIAVTVSPAAWADLFRHLKLPESQNLLKYQRKWTTLLHQTLRVSYVLDGNVPLDWSLQEAADEFCRAYRRTHSSQTEMDVDLDENERLQQQLTPSIALSSMQSQYLLNEGDTKTIQHSDNRRQQPKLPIFSSSCPALVCLIEKSIHDAVPHLATTKSTLAMAGAFWKRHANLFHLAIMPCHDKKLEASRKDFQDESAQKDVDMVITTQECLQLVQEAIDNQENSLQALQTIFERAPLAALEQHVNIRIGKNKDIPTLVTTPSICIPADHSNDSSTIFALGSGGYADYIFRHAAQELFDYTVIHVPWKPVTSESRHQSSVRVAAQRRRDFYHVSLYRLVDGSYSCEPRNDNSETVLRFAIANGMQTLQRVLKPGMNDEGHHRFDYVEAMACPSGCLNGGGQIRVAEKETPSETRQRVTQTQRYFAVASKNSSLVPLESHQMHTRYHVVPPLQHTLGAAAGVAVKDMQW